ncbi:HypC/HybG/HupF family hydrogenase formation chaperone [bacterium]|nr:HypC/HybG/HupF family hydrogenase formation chaperone [bacterium]
MCLGIPVKIISREDKEGIAEIGGVERKVDLRLLEGVEIGDYVIMHAGFAIQKLDEKEAQETLHLLQSYLDGSLTPGDY